MAEPLHELTITRLIAAPRAILWRCWTEPELIKEWFTPRPWTTPVVNIDLRAGGASYMLFHGPNGEEFPNRGVYLEVVPQEKLVFTDAYVDAWVPSAEPFMTAIARFSDEGGGTLPTRFDRFVLVYTDLDEGGAHTTTVLAFESSTRAYDRHTKALPGCLGAA